MINLLEVLKKVKATQVLMFFLGTHLLYANTMLLLDMQQVLVLEDKGYLINESPAIKMMFAVGYAIMSSIILYKNPVIVLIVLAAWFDGFCVYIRYNIYHPHFLIYSSLYFGAFTAFIVISGGLIRRNEMKDDSRNDNDGVSSFSSIDELTEKRKALIKRLNPTKNAYKRDELLKEIEFIDAKIKELNG